jgi:hypothetical protein
MGRAIGRPYRVAFIDTENGRPEITSRLRDQSAALNRRTEDLQRLGSNWIYVDTDEPGPLQYLRLDSSGFELLKQFVLDHDIEVLIVDNFGRVFPGKETEEDKVKNFFLSLKRLVNECPSLQRGMVVFLHHVTKPSNDGLMPDLLNDPYQWLARVRGSGRILDFSQVRLGFDEQTCAGEKYFVLNGLARSAKISPLIMERSQDGSLFQTYCDSSFIVDRMFEKSPRKRELFKLLSTLSRVFTFGDVERLRDGDGKPFHKQTISETLAAACANNVLEKSGGGYSFPLIQ